MGQTILARKDEPSNPFKKSGRTESTPTKRRSGGRRSGPPSPPSRSAPMPAVPPGTNKSQTDTKKSPEPISRGPAKAGKSVGLRKVQPPARKEKRKEERSRVSDVSSSESVSIVDSSDIQKPKRTEPENPFKKKAAKQTKRPAGRHGKRNRPQAPSKRIRKLNRGKYMEFKYDVRRILEEEDVEDEHRSNVLGQTWAKGERQGVNEAKDFLSEKVSTNIISQNCADRIIQLIDSLTTRR